MAEGGIPTGPTEIIEEWDGYKRRIREVRRPTIKESSKLFVLGSAAWIVAFLFLKFSLGSRIELAMLWGGLVGLVIANLWRHMKGRVPVDD